MQIEYCVFCYVGWGRGGARGLFLAQLSSLRPIALGREKASERLWHEVTTTAHLYRIFNAVFRILTLLLQVGVIFTEENHQVYYLCMSMRISFVLNTMTAGRSCTAPWDITTLEITDIAIYIVHCTYGWNRLRCAMVFCNAYLCKEVGYYNRLSNL